MTKKIFAMFLAVLMVVSVLPTSVFAANDCPAEHTKDNCDCTVLQVVAPDCGNYGYTSYQCNDCDKIFADSIVPATGEHTMVPGEAKAPTCGKPGHEAGLECEVCGFEQPGATIDPLFKAGTACEYKDLNPNIDCTTGGVKTFECVACGDTYTKKVGKSETGEHTWNYEKMTVKVAPAAGKAGIVVVTCDECKATKEVEWFPTHDCADSLELRAAVAASCTVDGNIEHYECRVCGKLYSDVDATNELRQNETVKYNGVIVKAQHTATIIASCNDKTYTCSVCKTKFVVEGKHVLGDAYIGTPVAATCTTKGYYTKECTLCHIPVVTEIPAKGHVEVTVSVPSTCHTYAYTFTACMREGCSDIITTGKTWVDADNGGVHYDISLGYTLASKLVTDEVKYNLSFAAEEGHLYIAGAVSGMFLAGEFAAAEGFYLETYKDYKGDKVANAYRLYTKDGAGNKTYYFLDEDGNIVPTTVKANDDGKFWSWNAAYGVLTYDLDGQECFLAGMEYMSGLYIATVMPIEYIAYGAVLGFEVVYLSYPVEAGTPLVDIDVDYEAKFNKDNHDFEEIKIPATCASAGSLTTYCKNAACNLSTTVVLEKVDHKWNELEDTQANLLKVNGAGFAASLGTLVHPASCTESGWHFEECEWCSEIRRVADPAEGHYWNTLVKKYQTADHMNSAYWYNECRYCDARNIISNVTAWEGANKVWDTYEAADDAHDLVEAKGAGRLYVAGSCTVTGLEMYTCATCKKVVYVKQQVEIKDQAGNGTGVFYTSGSHVVTPITALDGALAGQTITQDNYYMAPTCEAAGYVYTYTCLICGETIGNKALGKAQTLNKVAHSFVPVDNNNDGIVDNLIDPDEITNPCPNALPYSCAYCGATEYDVIFNNIGTSANLCEAVEMVIYICSCGEEHIRGIYGAYGHDYVNYTVDSKSTHFVNGSAHDTCAYCGDVREYTLELTPHKNAEGEKFTDACNDTVTDRHCIECCKHYGHFTMGNSHDCYKKTNGRYTCPCMIGKYHAAVEDVNDYMNSSCTMMPYEFFICKHCDGTIVDVVKEAISSDELKLWTAESNRLGVDVYYFYDKTDIYVMDGEEIVDIKLPYSAVNFKGHKPAEVDYDKDGNEIRYANYVYVPGYVWNSYNWELVAVPYLNDAGEVEFENEYVLVEYSETYTAKFEKYEASSYAADGSFKTHCQICDASVEQVLAKKSGLGFEMDVANANGQSGFGFGSLMEVTVSINALDAAIYGFEFEVENDMIFVGYEAVNDDFVISVTKPEEVAHNDKALKVAGFAVNNAEGKVQNIEITEKTAVVKLFFRVVGATGKHQFTFANAAATALKNGATKPAVVAANYEKCEFTIRGLMDFNKDGAASAADLYQAMTLITGEHSSGKTYDVTVDLNKDGELTLEDLAAGYDFLVGNYDAVDMLLMGLTEAEAAQLAELLAKAPAHKCINSACQYAADHAFIICPVCYTIQTSEAI